MKLNYDCIRDILITLEDKMEIDDDLTVEEISLEQICEVLTKYNKKEIFYCIRKLDEAGHIKTSITYANDTVYICDVADITYQGHEFLQNIKPDTVWKKTKEKCSKIGAMSIPIITTIAKEIISNLI